MFTLTLDRFQSPLNREHSLRLLGIERDLGMTVIETLAHHNKITATHRLKLRERLEEVYQGFLVVMEPVCANTVTWAGQEPLLINALKALEKVYAHLEKIQHPETPPVPNILLMPNFRKVLAQRDARRQKASS